MLSKTQKSARELNASQKFGGNQSTESIFFKKKIDFQEKFQEH